MQRIGGFRRDSTVELLHGVTIRDPYRWLENPNAQETKDFVAAQNVAFKAFLSNSSLKPKLLKSLTNLYNYEKIGCPSKRGSYYYYYYNPGLLPQYVLYRKPTLDSQTPTVFVDPNKLSDDGTISLSVSSFSKSGKYFAHGLSASGSDWLTLHVLDATKEPPVKIEKEPLKWAKFTTISWTHDDQGFFYNRYPNTQASDEEAGTETDSNKNAKIYYHTLNTPQEQDAVCFELPENPTHMPGAKVSFDGKYLILTVSESCNPANKLYIAELDGFDGSAKSLKLQKIVETFEAEYSYLTNDGPVFWFQTTLNAPNKRIVKYDLSAPEKGFVQVIPESPKDVLDDVIAIDADKLVLVYLSDVKHVIKLHSLYTGQPEGPGHLPLPLGSIVQSMTGERDHTELFYSFSSFTSPGTIYRYDFKTMSSSVYQESLVKGLKNDFFETRQVFYSSQDGTKVPMYIISRKGLALDGSHPTLLYGYGGFNISVTPRFSTTWLAFVQHMGGVVAVANIRGGGEYGKKWYEQGKLKNKQNVFDDFQAAAKYLVAEKYTSVKKLAINGGSNGGLLVGACINQAPELFGCAIGDVGVMDMLRFHKFTIGHAWTSDYGNPDDADDFKVIHKYSPLHNVRYDVEYPAVLITTGDHDDRVVPLHSLKLLATLQHALPDNKNPILGRIETKAGHGAGKTTQQILEEASDKFTFMGMTIGAEWTD